jgi:hypothetical protein
MAKYRIRYRRGGKEFDTVIELNALTRNQAMIMARENRGQFKDLDFSDVEIIDAEKVDSWK